MKNAFKFIVEPPTPRVAEALWLFAGALLLLVALGSLMDKGGPGPVALTELLAVLAPALLWGRARRRPVLAGLGLWPLRPVALLGGVLLGAGWFYAMSAGLEPQIERVLPMSEWERRRLLLMLRPPSGLRPLWQDLTCFAAVPALCEEVLFRGVLLPVMLQRLLRSVPPVAAALGALLASSLLFGAFHLSAGKLLPTAALGFGFGVAVLGFGSLWAGVGMHLCNNALVIVLVRAGHDEPPRGSWALVFAASAVAGLGVLAWHRRRQAAGSDRGGTS
ncbi:MAG: CPBP family intramembrane glutamic endopeptidase [Myxococcales bacterium]|nr:CPBP family intramembrane metalloprotease [Myxococcota bacterium]MDW8282280.1 CPBP family intramembrane glutamic endopeptidase [Myxococcales bacterium]